MKPIRMKIIRWIVALLWRKYKWIFVDVLNDEKKHIHKNPPKREVYPVAGE